MKVGFRLWLVSTEDASRIQVFQNAWCLFSPASLLSRRDLVNRTLVPDGYVLELERVRYAGPEPDLQVV